jgi:hypothetical protein
LLYSCTVNETLILKLLCITGGNGGNEKVGQSCGRAKGTTRKNVGKFYNIGNVTMVSVVLENSQNQRAVKLQRFMDYEM